MPVAPMARAPRLLSSWPAYACATAKPNRRSTQVKMVCRIQCVLTCWVSTQGRCSPSRFHRWSYRREVIGVPSGYRSRRSLESRPPLLSACASRWVISVGETGCQRSVPPFSCSRIRHCSGSRSSGVSASAPPRRQAVSVCSRMISESRAGSLPVDPATSPIALSRLSGSGIRALRSLRGFGTRAAGFSSSERMRSATAWLYMHRSALIRCSAAPRPPRAFRR